MLIRDEIARSVGEALARAQAAGQLPAGDLPDVPVERPPSPELGDFATSVALKLARPARTAPLVLARRLADELRPPPSVARVEVAPPGFVNFFLDPVWLARQTETILAAGPAYGSVALGSGQTVQVEWVSANPTGPLHVGTGRNAAIGDCLARILAKAGYRVQREYYFNDAGTQMDHLYASVYARYAQLLGRDEPFPEDGYPGEYVYDLARQIIAEHGDRFLQLPAEEGRQEVGRRAAQQIMAWIRDDLALMRVQFDRFFSEASLLTSGRLQQVLDLLRERGCVYERDGALWFAATRFGESKDHVLIRSNGLPGYFATDVAYHYDKFIVRGFDRVINVWGADHQGQVPRLKAALRALGVDPDRLQIVLYQLVKVLREGKEVRMGKRAGNFVTLREVLDEVGPDAVRYFLVSLSADAMLRFDLDLAKQQSDENPVYYVQYAHARIASILRRAAEEGFADFAGGDPALLCQPPEQALLRQMVRLPELVDQAARDLAPHPLPHYALDLAKTFSAFYRDCRVVQPDRPELTRARLKLVAACKVVLANTLELIGVEAPERMVRAEAG